MRKPSPSILRSLCGILSIATMASAAPDAEARGRRVGVFIGGVVVGALVARPRVVYAAPAYPYYYYGYPYPAPVYVAPPPVVVPAPVVPVQPLVPQTGIAPQAAAPAQSPTQIAAPQSLEERLRRLQGLCDQGLLTATECSTRREQLLQEI